MRETVEPNAVLGEPPPLCAKWQFPSCREANHWWRNTWAASLSQRDRPRYFPAGVDLSGGRA